MTKFTLDQWRESISHFLDFHEVEHGIQEEVERDIQAIRFTSPTNGTRAHEDVLEEYLADTKQKSKRKLAVMVHLAGGSLERLQRVFAARFSQDSWKDWSTKDSTRKWVASFLVNPYEDRSLFVPRFIRDGFRLPHDWMERITDGDVMRAVVRATKNPTYAVRMGFELEERIKKCVANAGLKCDKGPVKLVDNKEVDVVVPNRSSPSILIMSSYAITTSSNQTSKANEQRGMYGLVRSAQLARARNKKCLFINVVDGGGWLARKNDLEHLWLNCDYCFSHSTLDELENLLKTLEFEESRA